MFKKLLIVTLSITAFLCCAFFPRSFNVYAEKQSINYVALGDSIAEGYAINMKTKTESEELILGADTSFDIVEGCYVDLIRDELDKTYNTMAYNFAYSGYTCQDLIDFIAEFYDASNNVVINSSLQNTTYPSLTNQELFNTLQNANIITVCIGANNILSIARDLVCRFLGIGAEEAITRADMEEELRRRIIGYTDPSDSSNDIKGLQAEMSELLEVLYKINSNSYIYFTSIYNPYKVLHADADVLALISSFYPKFTQDNLNVISSVTELALSGGEDSAGQGFIGINNIIQETIKAFNKQHQSKFKCIDSKSSFDAKCLEDNEANYNNYVNVKVDELGYATNIDPDYIHTNFFDPHPTYAGHSLIANAHISSDLEIPVFNYSTKVNNSALQNTYTLQEGQLEFNTQVDNNNYTYTYSYIIKRANEIIKTLTTNPITFNHQDYVSGAYDVYLTITAQKGDNSFNVCTEEKLTTINVVDVEKFTVAFVTNCNDILPSQSIALGSKVSQPDTISKPNHSFVGWYVDKDFSRQWDFETDVVEGDITLYAKWVAITFNVTFDYNGGVLNEQDKAVVQVIQNGYATKPDDASKPILNNHRLIGWFVNLTDEQPYDFNTPITSDITLYAKWDKIIFDVTFDYNGGNFNGQSKTVVEVNKGGKVLPLNYEPIKEDYKFDGWFKDVDCLVEWDFENETIYADVSIYAKWVLNVVFVHLEYNGGIFNGDTSRTLKLEKNFQLTETSETAYTLKKSGYKFAYWYLTDELTPIQFPITVTEDITLYAYWKDAIKINVYYYTQDIEYLIFKGTNIGELYEQLKPQKDGTCFLGWFQDAYLRDEFADNVVLQNNQNVYVKWMTLNCIDESLLQQSFSPITKLVAWTIDAKDGTKLAWKVNGQIVKEMVVNGNEGASWSFAPTSVGLFEISCIVCNGVDSNPLNGTEVKGKTVKIVYSTPAEISITLTKVIDKKTYIVEVDNRQYYDESKFVWFKTSDHFSDDFSMIIGTGYELNYKFNSDCKICVKYLENEDSTDGIVSNSIEIEVDNFVDETTLFAIIVSVALVALITIGVVLSRKKYKNFF